MPQTRQTARAIATGSPAEGGVDFIQDFLDKSTPAEGATILADLPHILLHA